MHFGARLRLGGGQTCLWEFSLHKVRQLSNGVRVHGSEKGKETMPDITSHDQSSDVPEKEKRLRREPGNVSVLLFPGQGSQFVGMGRGLLKYGAVQDMFSVARKILGYDLLSLCLNGPEEDLMKTVHCQPAVFVTSLAAVERLNDENPAVSNFSNVMRVWHPLPFDYSKHTPL